MLAKDIYTYIKEEEAKFETDEIQVGENWFWNFRKHVQLIFHLKNGVFFNGDNDYLRAFKNVMEPILNLAYWTEDLEVKDVVFFVENGDNKVLSFLLKKYHDEVYVKEHDLDELFDEITESDVDYGGVLVQKTNKKRPQTIALNSIAFCDQTNIMNGPIAFKHVFSPSRLKKISALGWGEESNGADCSIDDLIALASYETKAQGVKSAQSNSTPGKSIDIYITRGDFPDYWIDGNKEEYTRQVHIVAFYIGKDNQKIGCTLYKKREYEDSLLFHTSQKVYGRALGRGTGESLIHPQIWTNWLTIHKNAMVEAGSKVLIQTDDPTLATKNDLRDKDNLEVVELQEGRQAGILNTLPVNNIQIFSNSINEWYEQAQLVGSAFDPVLGKEPASGTTFRGQERVVAQGRGLHDRRRGQRAKFIEKIYREAIIPDMKREILKGKKFLAELSYDEMSWVAEQLANNYVNNRLKSALLENGKIPTNEELALMRETFKESFNKAGNKKLIEMLRKDFENVEIKMGINIAGKQKNLADMSDKVLSIFQFAFANPEAFQQAMQNPGLARAFSDILEFSGMSQANFSAFMSAPAQLTPPVQQNVPELQLNQQSVEA